MSGCRGIADDKECFCGSVVTGVVLFVIVIASLGYYLSRGSPFDDESKDESIDHGGSGVGIPLIDDYAMNSTISGAVSEEEVSHPV